jgi:hypothetical protein
MIIRRFVLKNVFFLILTVSLAACGGGDVTDVTDVTDGWLFEATTIDETTDAGNVHYNSGGRRIVRMNETTIALVNHGSSDNIYRSADNGVQWTPIDFEDGFSGCLVSGVGNFVYHFSRYGSNVRMVKFLYNAVTVPAPVNIFTSLGSSDYGAYTMLNATVDENGSLYVFVHCDTGSGGDTIFLLKSSDEGATWSAPITVRAGDNIHSYGSMHSDVTADGDIILVYSEWGSLSSQFAVSHDDGGTWTHVQIAERGVPGQWVSNPAVLPVGSADIFVFGQSPDLDGLVFKKSTDAGVTWSSNWTSIQANHTNGYADPSPALGSDGTIYVAFRGASSSTALSDDLREYIAMSTDNGNTWTFPDNHLSGGRVGTRSTLRYQTWHNYGGPLEWTWLEEAGEDTEVYPTMYDQNINVTIDNLD